MTATKALKARLGRLVLACPALAAVPVAVQRLQAQGGPGPIPVPNPGFEQGTPGEAPPEWGGSIRPGASAQRPGSPYQARIDAADPHEGRASVR